ncbi:hypothetical protein JXQ70_15800 [bacterium]|nr:hypothetical protein [bacterium]
MFKKMFFVVLFILTCSWVAAFPPYLNYQGMLTDSAGNPVTSFTVIIFTFWDAETGGNQLGSFSDSDNVTPNDQGMFSTLIGDVSIYPIPESIFDNETVYLNVNINGENLIPRKRLTSAAFAFTSGDLQCTGCVSTDEIAPDAISTDHLQDESVSADKLGTDLKVSFHAYQASGYNQELPDSAWTKVLFNTEFHDDGDVFDTATGTFTCPVSGVYHFNAYVQPALGNYETGYNVALYRNNSPIAVLSTHPYSNASAAVAGGGITIKLNAGQTVSIYVWHMAGIVANVISGYPNTWFTGHRVY